MSDNSYDFITETLLSIFENTEDMIFIKDKNLRYIIGSKAFATLVNLKECISLRDKTDFDIFDKDLATKYTNDDKYLLSCGRNVINYLEPLPDKNGKKRIASTSKFLLKDKNGEIVGLYGISRDITAQIELESEIEYKEASSQFFEAILNADLTNDIMLQSKDYILLKLLQLDKAKTFTDSVNTLVDKFIHDDYKEEFLRMYNRENLLAAFNSGKTKFNHIVAHNLDGKKYFYEFDTKLYYSKVSNSVKITTAITDIDKDIKNQEKLKKQAFTDGLTGLLNRSGAERKILEYLESNSNQKHALLFIDLDKFKNLNDSYGHLYGDKVLNEIGARLKLFNDENHIIGRFGGDEFIVFIKNISDMNKLKHDIQNFIDTLCFYNIKNDDEIIVTCTIGVSIYEDKKSLKTLYQEADEAMYQAKINGKNRYYFYKKDNG